MKLSICISFVAVSILITCCNYTKVEKISTVTVSGSNTEPYNVELSHSVLIPITKSGAIFIMEECYERYNSSLGEPELIDEMWVFYWSPEFPDFRISVNRNDGYVLIEQFG